MNWDIETSIPMLTVLIQGLLSFFSPCVLPLIPLYMGYLSGGARSQNEDGITTYHNGKVMLNTLFFVLGISFAFFALGLGFTAIGRFFNHSQALLARIGGFIVVLFGLYQIGIFGRFNVLQGEHRFSLKLDKMILSPWTAWLLGFLFSFAWTPCVGPTLASVLLMVASSATSTTGLMLIGVYTLGFVLPFLALGLFTGKLLDFFKRHQYVIKYTVKIGGFLMVLMGIMMVTGWMNHITGYLGGITFSQNSSPSSSLDSQSKIEDTTFSSTETPNADSSASESMDETAAPDFTLIDQYGESHTLSDYKGKTIFLNFWATWCPPCRSEMPDIQGLYESWKENTGEVIVLGVAGPNMGSEGSKEEIAEFLTENQYTYPVVMDETGDVFSAYGISAFPTTFMIDTQGRVYGYVPGAISRDIMDSIVEQTMEQTLDTTKE